MTASSDLKVVLQHIDALLCQTSGSIHAVSGQLMAVAIAIECITLAQKLQRTLQRWRVYLPFKECADVDFKWWLNYLSKVHKDLNSHDTVRPEAPFLVDYVELLDSAAEDPMPFYMPRYADSELQIDVREYVYRTTEEIDRIRSLNDDEELEWFTLIDREGMRILSQQYADYLRVLFTGRHQYTPQKFQEEILPKATTYLRSVINQPVMAYCLDMALNTLLDILRQIDDLFSSDFSEQQLLRLSLRLYHRHCPDAEQSACQEVHRWAASWPLRHRQERAHQKRDQILSSLRQQFSEPSLDDYIDTERPCPLTDAEFGRFLFARRHQLTIGEVKELFADCFRIQHLNRIIDPASAEADISASRLSSERKQVYQRLSELIRKAEWRGGMTVERVHSCFAQILFSKEESSDLFWGLLTSRRNCEDGFRSLKLTWLNLVGYFRKRDFLKGGSLTLCRYFFPDGTEEGRNNTADHNAVNKGTRNDAGNDFADLVKVLDRLLELEPPKTVTRVKS